MGRMYWAMALLETVGSLCPGAASSYWNSLTFLTWGRWAIQKRSEICCKIGHCLSFSWLLECHPLYFGKGVCAAKELTGKQKMEILRGQILRHL